MAISITQILANAKGENYNLHAKHVNPRFVKTLKTIGFDQRYLDMLSGYGVFNIGRNNPQIRQTLIDFMQVDYPSLVQLDAPLLSGLLAKEL